MRLLLVSLSSSSYLAANAIIWNASNECGPIAFRRLILMGFGSMWCWRAEDFIRSWNEFGLNLLHRGILVGFGSLWGWGLEVEYGPMTLVMGFS